MPRGYPALSELQKREIIDRVKNNGEKVSELSKEYGVLPKSIYNLLAKEAIHPNLALEVSKLKREKDVLLKIIGQLVTDNKLGKKNNY